MANKKSSSFRFQNRYDPSACVNIITRVGFGKGHFRSIGVRVGRPYVLPLTAENGTTHFFNYKQIKQVLTFDWFKHNVVCRDQVWLCRDYIGP